ncbi:site-specific integrase [Lentzea sp. NPDC042327]|uniref:tyrosine-type recombinase/integrase n=1 Tax=Lentzea sp. NPDC042327 TaxID=3154801 RepID=UPI0033F48C56
MGSSPADLQVLVQMMERLGVAPEELLAVVQPESVPTFEQFVPVAFEATSQGSRAVFQSYWNRIVACWGTRRLDEPTPRELVEVIEHFRATAKRRRHHTNGAGAAKHAYDALERLYRVAVDERVLSSQQNPMLRVRRPRRAKTRRYALSSQLLDCICRTAAETGQDPRLDALLIRFHLETAARPSGALNLRLEDLDVANLLVTLTEKGTKRQQPVSLTLMEGLLDHAKERGVQDKESQLFRFPDGRPMSKLRYLSLWARLGRYIEVVYKEGITTYWLRHTTLTWVERNFGLAVARAYGGHAENHLWYGVTAHYVKASLAEVATALQTLTGEPHPLASPGSLIPQRSEVLPTSIYGLPPRSEPSSDQYLLQKPGHNAY